MDPERPFPNGQRGHQLHETDRPGTGDNLRVERRFRSHDRADQRRIHPVRVSGLLNKDLVGLLYLYSSEV